MRLWVLFRATVLATSVGVGAHAASARAEYADLALDLRRCPDISASEVLRITAVELKLQVLPLEQSPSSSVSVALACSESSAELSLVDRVTQKSVQRVVDLSTTPPLARPRLLALSVAELVSASWAELEVLPEPERAESSSVQKARSTVQRRRPRGLAASAHAQAAARLWASGWSSFGPRLRLELTQPLSRRLAWVVASGLGAEHGVSHEATGSLSINVFDAELSALLEGDWQSARLGAGAGLRGGLVHASGTSSDPARVAGRAGQDGYLSSVLTVYASFVPATPLSIGLGIEGGWAFRPVDVNAMGQQGASVGPIWVGAIVGVGVRL